MLFNPIDQYNLFSFHSFKQISDDHLEWKMFTHENVDEMSGDASMAWNEQWELLFAVQWHWHF